MAWTQSDVDALESAIVTAAVDGFAELRLSDRSARGYTLDELLKLRAVMKSVVTSAAAGFATNLVQHSRG